MKTVSQLVFEWLTADPIMQKYLTNDLLNLSKIAEIAKPYVEDKIYKQVSKGSIVTALSRIKDKELPEVVTKKFQIQDFKLKFPITELVFAKNGSVNQAISKVYKLLGVNGQDYLNINDVENEIDIFVSSPRVNEVKKTLSDLVLIETVDKLAVLTLKYNPEYRKYSGMAAQVLQSLATRGIHMMECLTTYSEFVLYIYQSEVQRTVEALQADFMI